MKIEAPKGSLVVSGGERMSVTTEGLSYDEHVATPVLPSRPWHVSQEAVRNANAHMIEALRSGRPADISGDDNLKTCALAEAAYRSAGSHTEVRPPG